MVISVPTIDQCIRIPDEAIDDIIRQIVEKFHPQQIILFGSYAAGRPQPESDVDLLVVMDTSLRESEQAYLICREIDYLFGLDLLVISPQRLKQRLEWGDSFLKEIIQAGVLRYESPNT